MLHKYILLMLKCVACFAWINTLIGLFLFQRIPIFCFIFINKKYTLLLSTSLALKMSNVLKMNQMSKQFNNIQTQRYQLTTNMYSIIGCTKTHWLIDIFCFWRSCGWEVDLVINLPPESLKSPFLCRYQ